MATQLTFFASPQQVVEVAIIQGLQFLVLELFLLSFLFSDVNNPSIVSQMMLLCRGFFF
jgi:hypothetical protein